MVIESDRDAQEALAAFIDASGNNQDVRYRSIHVRECSKVLLQREDRFEPLEPETERCSSRKRICQPGESSDKSPSKRKRTKPKVYLTGVEFHMAA